MPVTPDQIEAACDKVYADWIGRQGVGVRECIAVAVRTGLRLAEVQALPRRSGLTAKQRDLLAFIQDFSERHGIAPSFDEMAKAIGVNSKSGVHRLITGLEERGAIVRLKNRARAIELIGAPITPQPAQVAA